MYTKSARENFGGQPGNGKKWKVGNRIIGCFPSLKKFNVKASY